MKKVSVLCLAALIMAAGQASAACTSILDKYNGTIPANSFAIAHGPFTITSANGCQQANISSTITAVGAGTPPKVYIDRQTGTTWTEVNGGAGNTASFLGPLGTYRIRHVNNLNVDRQYSGTTRYAR